MAVLKRYYVYGDYSIYDPAAISIEEDRDGAWCKAEDVLPLIAELESTVAAQQAFVDDSVSLLKRANDLIATQAADIDKGVKLLEEAHDTIRNLETALDLGTKASS